MQHGESLRLGFHFQNINDVRPTAIAVTQRTPNFITPVYTIINHSLPIWRSPPTVPAIPNTERYSLASFCRSWLLFHLYARVDCYEKT